MNIICLEYRNLRKKLRQLYMMKDGREWVELVPKKVKPLGAVKSKLVALDLSVLELDQSMCR